ncbi:hypothetical protein OROGR_028985 [Orobanche gracilis]
MAGYSTSVRALSSSLLLLHILMSSLLMITAKNFYPDYYLHDPTCSYINGTHAYANNLDNLFNDLRNNTPLHDGFFNASSGQEPDRVNGLALCRGDISAEASTGLCQACLTNVAVEIKQACNRSLAAIVWHDFCFLKYSNQSFFGNIDNVNTFGLVNRMNVHNPVPFHNATIEFLGNLTAQATDPANTRMFARGEILIPFSNGTTIYAMAQCTRDLASDDCRGCLDGAVKDLPGIVTAVNGTVISMSDGARRLTGSCNVSLFKSKVYLFLSLVNS